MKPYQITITTKRNREQHYQLFARSREDVIDFVRRVHRIDFGKVLSCKQIKRTHVAQNLA